MKRRGSPRVDVSAPAAFLSEGFVGDGQITNLSASGCVIESDHIFHPGDHVALRLRVPDEGEPLDTDLATVRWVEGRKCGVEFIRISEKTKERLRSLTMATFIRIPGGEWKRVPM